MGFTVTVLAENSVFSSGVIGEHGFSALIEREDKRILFDTGQGMCLPHNLEAMKKALPCLDAVALSHGHYDHTGGLKWVIQEVGEVEVLAHPALFSRHMARDSEDPQAAPYFVGCPFGKEELEALGARFKFVTETTRMGDGLWFIAGISRRSALEPRDPRLVAPGENGLVQDSVADDASLLVEDAGSSVLILGCAHAGVINILDHVRNEMGFGTLDAIVGGTHLLFSSEEMISRVIEALEAFSPNLVAVSHCTGWRATARLLGHFGDRFRVASAGTVFSF